MKVRVPTIGAAEEWMHASAQHEYRVPVMISRRDLPLLIGLARLSGFDRLDTFITSLVQERVNGEDRADEIKMRQLLKEQIDDVAREIQTETSRYVRSLEQKVNAVIEERLLR